MRKKQVKSEMPYYGILPMNPGGERSSLVDGAAGYLAGGLNAKSAYELYPEALLRILRAVAREAEAMKREGVPPFGKA